MYLNSASYNNVEKILNSFQFEDIVIRHKIVDSFTRFGTFFFLFSFSRVSLNLKIVIDSTLTFAKYKLVIDGTIGLNSSKKDIRKKKRLFCEKSEVYKRKNSRHLESRHMYNVRQKVCCTTLVCSLSTAQFLYYMTRKRITSRDMIGCKGCTGSVTLSSL
jgi:hypothetical protein